MIYIHDILYIEIYKRIDHIPGVAFFGHEDVKNVHLLHINLKIKRKLT